MNQLSLPLSIAWLVLFGFSATKAQLATLDESTATRLMLENNFNIRLAKNDVKLATNNTSKELNGYYPVVDFTAGPTATLGSSTQQLFSGQENKVNSAFSWGANASVGANYTIYDKTRELNVAQLQEVLNLTDLQLRQTMELNLLDVLTSYYQLAQLTERLELQAETIQLSQRRKQRAQYRFDYGQGNKLEVLNAQVDIQRDTVALLNLEQQIANSKRSLNLLIGTELGTDYQVDTSVQYLQNPQLNELLKQALSNNVQLLLLRKNMELQEYDLKINEATFMPRVSTTASYGVNFQDNAEGSFVTSSNSRGWNLGVNVAWNLYDGGLRKARKENIIINVEGLLVQREQIEQQLSTNIRNAWQSYQNALFVLAVERDNLATAEINFKRTEEQFNAGQINSVEFRQAQLNLLNAAASLNGAKYDAKVIEVQLLQLSGNLLK
ncbi:MAG: TolC family protein [Bacteroidota bacterium]